MHVLTVVLKETKENALKSFDEKMKEDEVKILQLTSELEGKEAEINTLRVKSLASMDICIMLNSISSFDPLL